MFRIVRVRLLSVWLLGLSTAAAAQNIPVGVAQYKHTSWKSRDGFAGGMIQAFAQTADGYLWLGTTEGLYRFDGMAPVRWEPPPGAPMKTIGSVAALVAARDGALWIAGFSNFGRLKDGVFTVVPTPGGRRVNRIVEGHDGAIWIVLRSNDADAAPLCRVVGGAVECTELTGVAGTPVGSVFADANGTIWAGSPTGVAQVVPGPVRQFPLPPRPNGLLFAERDGALLVSSTAGLERFDAGRTELVYPSPPSVAPHGPSAVMRDREGALWVGTMGRGLWHVRDGRTDVFAAADGLSSDSISAFFEDREGSIWVATFDGLDRFRPVVAPTYYAARTFSNGAVSSVLSSRDGSLWIGTLDGLNHWDGERLTVYRDRSRPLPAGAREVIVQSFPSRVSSMFEDSAGRLWVSDGGAGYLEGRRFVRVVEADRTVWSIVEDAQHDIWISLLTQLVRVRGDGRTEAHRFTDLGATTFVTAAAADARRGGLWLGFADGTVMHYRDGRVERRHSTAVGSEPGMVYHLRPAGDGALWAATRRGLVRVSETGIATLDSTGGLPCDSVHWSMPDEDGSVWLYMPCGLVRLRAQELEAWAGQNGDDNARSTRVSATLFDSADGVRLLTQPTHFQPQVSRAPDGRIWFSTLDGVAVIDPKRMRLNTLPPPVHIEAVVADRTLFGARSGLRLPPLVRDLQIDYTALSLVAPEKNRFRITLEGRDADWQEVGTRRQAFYTDLAPATYRFRVMASNNNGVWNETGAVLEFSIAPAYYQARWFRVLVAVGAIALVSMIYLARDRQVRRDYQRRLEERVNERTRIARELHDTLLQSFQALLLRFQTVSHLLDEESQARQRLDSAIAQAEAAITEGRDAVQALRSSTTERNDLAKAITALGAELTTVDAAIRPALSVQIEGGSRALHPIARDEVYKVAAEAVRNAFKHAHATHIHVDIRYDDDQLRVRVRDDGKGIDSAFLMAREHGGHYGLDGMRERAALIGGTLTIRSDIGAGTEIELRVPANAVYAAPSRPWLLRTKGTRL